MNHPWHVSILHLSWASRSPRGHLVPWRRASSHSLFFRGDVSSLNDCRLNSDCDVNNYSVEIMWYFTICVECWVGVVIWCSCDLRTILLFSGLSATKSDRPNWKFDDIAFSLPSPGGRACFINAFLFTWEILQCLPGNIWNPFSLFLTHGLLMTRDFWHKGGKETSV